MDKIDIKILSHLLDNCRKPDRQLGKEIGISGAAVKSRIKKMIDNKIIEEFTLKIEPPVLGYSVLYFVVIGKEINDILNQIRLIGEPFFVIPCVGGITVCSIIVKGNPSQKMELAKSLLRNVRVLNIFEAKNPEIRSDLTKTDIEIINILLQTPRLRIEEVAKKSGLSTKTIARSLDKLQNDEAIQFTVIYNPKKMGGFIPFAILVGVKGAVRDTLSKLAIEFSGLFLQKPFVHMDQVVLFMYTDNIYKMDDIAIKIHDIEEIHSVDLFIPKTISFPQKWVRDAIEMAKSSKKLHLMSEIHS
jgi:DNA-binding Lrp family transcriptional regulator